MRNETNPDALETGGGQSTALVPSDVGAAPAGAADADSDAAFYSGWLNSQCAALAGARAGVVLRAAAGGLHPAASWPASRQSPMELVRIAERAANATRPVIAWMRRTDGKAGLDLLIGVAFRSDGALIAVIAAMLEAPNGIESVDPDAFAEQLRMGGGWLDARLFRLRAQTATSRIERASVAMDIVAVASMERRPARSAAAVVNELAIRLNCGRVSLGLLRRGGVKLKALSHIASFEQRGRVVDAIENAMEECLAQSASVAFPPLPATQARISVAHRDLAALDRVPTATASVVLPGPTGPAGVLTFERDAGAPFDEQTLLLVEAAGALLGPVLRIQSTNDRIVSGRIVNTVEDGAIALLGHEKPSLKLAAIVALLLFGLLCVVKGEFRVTARAVLEGEVQRAAVAPFDGFIAESPVRPGDHLHAGDLLAAMDDRDLVLDRARAWSDAQKAREQYSQAMAKHDRPNVAVLAAQIAQAEAQLALADDKLRRSRVVSPIDGIVVSGDLSQQLGTPVERGKTLFEIAPLNQYRIAIATDERDLRYVSVSQHGQLALSSMPADLRGFTVTRITPIAEAKDGENQFRVEATLDDPPGEALRPGMEGVAKIETGSHNLVWVWTHLLVDWLRLTVWKWMP